MTRASGSAPSGRDGLVLAAVALALASATFWTFAPALGHSFLIYDDDQYVTANRTVQAGLTWAGLRWAFTTGHAANWHPFTWLSHMADVQLWGLDATGHHLSSMLLHAANVALLFVVLRGFTGALWPSALVAALFGLHPTRVESVAWVAERKDVLSTLFALVTLRAYGAWTARPTPGRYAAALAAFAAGLMAKPMLVTLPFVLLLLDVWPLRRLAAGGESARRTLGRRAAEKWPFFLLAAASSLVTFFVQRAGGAVQTLESHPLDVRLANAAVAYAGYLRRLVWPANLAVFYPHPGPGLTLPQTAGALLLLAGLSVLAARVRRRHPYVLVGWLWFLGMLVPVIGIVQVGFQALADRYSYLPYVGLLVAMAWTARSLVEQAPRAAPVALVAGLVAVVGSAAWARADLEHWRDSETLFRRALAVTHENYVAHQNLAHHLNETGRPSEAVPHLEEALRIRPAYPEARVNLGRSLFLLGRVDEAIAEFERALRLRPADPVAWNNLAFSRMSQGDLAETARLYRRALELQPEWADVQHRAGIVEIMQGEWTGCERLQRATELEPANSEHAAHSRGCPALRGDLAAAEPEARALREYLIVSHRQAAGVLSGRSQLEAALEQLSRAERLDPRRADIQDEIGVLLARLGRRQEAIEAFETAVRLDPSLPSAHNNLGFLLFERGQHRAAVGHYREALRLAPDFSLARRNLELAEARSTVEIRR